MKVNGETHAEFRERVDGRRWLDRTQSENSNDCKTCIDAGSEWCIISADYASGYCCDGEDLTSCPTIGDF